MAPTVDLELRTVVQVGIGFFCVLFAFLTQSIIEQAVISSAAERGDIGEHAGYLSLAIIYFFFFVGNFVAVPVIECTNAKWTMTAGAASFIFFQVGFLHLKEYYLYASSAVLGFGSGFFWTGQGSYLAQISKAKNSRRNSGILWALFQSSIAVGGMFLLAIFTFVSTEQKISERTVTLLYTVFSAANVVGVLVLALLPNATTYGVELLNSPRKNFDVLETFASIFHVLTSKKMFLIGFAFCFTGLSNSMYSSVYSTVIAFTKRLGTNTNALMAIYAIVMGSGQIVGGCVFGLLGEKTKRLGRKNIIIGGMALHLATFSAIFVNFPAEASLKATDDVSLIEPSITIAMVCGFMLGLGDAIWNTQIYAFLVDNYSTRSSQAFAIYKATQAIANCAAFFYGSFINLTGHLAIITVMTVLGAIGFYRCETIIEREKAEKERNSSDITGCQEMQSFFPLEALLTVDCDSASRPLRASPTMCCTRKKPRSAPTPAPSPAIKNKKDNPLPKPPLALPCTGGMTGETSTNPDTTALKVSSIEKPQNVTTNLDGAVASKKNAAKSVKSPSREQKPQTDVSAPKEKAEDRSKELPSKQQKPRSEESMPKEKAEARGKESPQKQQKPKTDQLVPKEKAEAGSSVSKEKAEAGNKEAASPPRQQKLLNKQPSRKDQEPGDKKTPMEKMMPSPPQLRLQSTRVSEIEDQMPSGGSACSAIDTKKSKEVPDMTQLDNESQKSEKSQKTQTSNKTLKRPTFSTKEENTKGR
ncbi:hypothetical protein QR680_017982 [Steinernema hermaphroditum]|uniref:UNC93-like protein MFSD11 n=1 Tax=Steinernema hermaphroditum TaxID=289476 RepID=A0AA39HIK9_9BILA|nr:hypothetical protein QR680_017982 [Steinernema hermaphroditum]